MKNIIAQETELRDDGCIYIRNDWYPKAIPENLVIDDMVYLDSMYSFACFHSKDKEGFKMGYASGNYLHSHFLVGEKGKVSVGKYTILEATNILANDSVCIGDHCMFSWGSYITDSWLNENSYSSVVRKDILKKLAHSQYRYLEIPDPKPVIIEDNVWIGFDAIILPGVRIGRGAVIGCKTIITDNVPAYAVVVGNPSRIIKFLEPSDTEEMKAKAIKEFVN